MSPGAVAKRDNRWITLLVAGAAVALAVVDITVVNVALPRILDALDLAVIDGEWINTAYSLTFAAALITMGRLGDRYGRKRILLLGLVVFGVGSVLAAAAGSLGPLIGSRVVQGLGASAIFPATLSLIHSRFKEGERALAFGVWGSLIAGVAAIGPLVGGLLTATWGWRYIFVIQVPVVLLVVGLASTLLDPDPGTDRDGVSIPGMLWLSVGLVSVVLGLSEGPRFGWLRLLRPVGWSPAGGISFVPVALAAGLSSMAGFFVWCSRSGRPERVADIGLFRLPRFRIGNLLVFLVGMGEFGVVFVMPLFLQAVLGLGALETGVWLVAMAGGGLVGGVASGLLARRLGPRRAVVAGLGIEAIAALGIGGSVWTRVGAGMVAGLALYGVGVGIASAQLASLVLYDVPSENAGQAAAIQSTVRQLGAAFGVATLGTIYVSVLGRVTRVNLAGIAGLSPSQRGHITERVGGSSGWYVEALRAWTPDFAVVVDAVERALALAATAALVFTALVFAWGAVAALRLPNDTPTVAAAGTCHRLRGSDPPQRASVPS